MARRRHANRAVAKCQPAIGGEGSTRTSIEDVRVQAIVTAEGAANYDGVPFSSSDLREGDTRAHEQQRGGFGHRAHASVEGEIVEAGMERKTDTV
jgi:hypothetical protein